MEKNLGGRPRVIESPEKMDELVDEYFANCRATDEPITLTGMILHLGLNSRAALDAYATYDGFFNPVKRAKLLIESEYEKDLKRGERGAAGSIFALKNFGWRDQQAVEMTGSDGSPLQMAINFIGTKKNADD